jgi:hypothetical protein
MKKLMILTMLIGLGISLKAELKQTTMVEVSFPRFGTYRSESSEVYQSINRFEESQGELEGKGFWGNLASKFFPSGKQSVIYNLNEKMVYNVNFEKETYSKRPIEKFFDEEDFDEEDETDDTDIEEEEDDRYRIIRREFDVKEGKKKEKINQFDARQYQILYLLEKEEIATKKRFTDSLFVMVYASDNASFFDKAQSIKQKHQEAMLEAIGLKTEEEEQSKLLGLNWLEMLSVLDSESSSANPEIDFIKLQKIKGHPILVEGSFYQKEYDPSLQAAKSQPKKKTKGFGFGSIMDKVVESVQDSADDKRATTNNQYQMLLSYRTETKEISFDSVSADLFSAPKGFKEIK